VNTVYMHDGAVCGTNTDGIGFIRNLEAGAPQWRASDGPAIVLGAGGAARAVVAALTDAGVPDVRITNRTRARAEALANRFGPAATAHDWSTREDILADGALLVNTTTLGMTGAPPRDIALDRLSEAAVVCDIVYAPLDTDLLVRARARGNPVVDGLGMLLHQAAPGFALWFGVVPDVTDELRALIVADLEAR
ncbi:MAG: shikimate dehydrogenase family protein, partial [Hyphomicrobiales bacterium]